MQHHVPDCHGLESCLPLDHAAYTNTPCLPAVCPPVQNAGTGVRVTHLDVPHHTLFVDAACNNFVGV